MKEYLTKYNKMVQKHSNGQDLIMADFLSRLALFYINDEKFDKAL